MTALGQENKSSTVLFAFVLLFVTAVSFAPSLKNGFVHWDDNVYLVENPLVKNFSWQNTAKIFTDFKSDFYKPLVTLSYSAEYHWFGFNPAAYHATNLFLHLLNCLLVFWLIFILSGNQSVGFITALMFGIHPMHVESVAWAAERKDVLYGFFFLGSIVAYLFYKDHRSQKAYWVSFLLFLGSLLSKPAAVGLPFVLMVLDYFRGEKWLDRKVVFEKLVFFAAGLVFGIMMLVTQRRIGAMDFYRLTHFFDNMLLFTDALVFYGVKIFCPMKLSCIYPFPAKPGFVLHPALFSPVVLTLAVGAVVFYAKAFSRTMVFGLLFFLITIFPMSGFIPAGPAMVADRYTYIPSIGFFYGFAEAFVRISKGAVKARHWLLTGLVFLTAVYSFLTWNRCQVWKDDWTLWNNVLEHYPDIPTAIMHRANIYCLSGRPDKAIEEYNKAIRLAPRYAEIYVNRGNAYMSRGEYPKGIADFKHALALKPDYSLARDNLRRAQNLLFSAYYMENLD